MIKKLKDLGDLKSPKQVIYSEGTKYNIAGIASLDSLGYSFKYKTTDMLENLLQKGDIAIVSFDYSDKNLGYSFYIDEDNKYVAGSETIILSNCKVNAEALAYYMQSYRIKKQIQQLANLALTTSKRITRQNLEELEINITTLSQLEKKLETLRDLNKLLTQHYNSLEKTIILQNFARKKLFEEIKDEKTVIFSDCFNISLSAQSKPERIINKIYPVITNASLKQDGYADISNTPDIFILYNARGGKAGEASVVKEKAFVTNKNIIIYPKFKMQSNINNQSRNCLITEAKDKPLLLNFVALQLSYFKYGLTGTGIKFVSVKELSESKLIVPALDEQKRITECLESFEKNINARQEYINRLILLKEYLLNKKKEYYFYV